ncbi:MAG: hypothetical protein HY881_23235 [Deltaproteobacteria bacterium]|nr:hypothetical protein [Deltaproteobacteria bacterium]
MMNRAQDQAVQIVLDPEIPGGVYLCQVSETVSCGACCGLYNVAGLSRDGLYALLAKRTHRFSEMAGRNLDAVLSFRKWVEESEPQERPFPEFHHCPYIGLIGRDASRPGCLLHPLGNSGIDLRGISDYGGFACRTYFCPTHDCLSADIKILIRKAARDWFEYGLMITEASLVQAFLDVAGHVAACRTAPDPDPADIMRELMDLKCCWPYRSDPASGLIHYFFNDKLYARAPVDYAAIGAEASPYNRIFQELGSGFDSVKALREAEAIVEALLKRTALLRREFSAL